MHRFYLNDFSKTKNYKITDKNLVFQIKKVLRFQVWEKIILFNAKDLFDCVYEIVSLDDKHIVLSFLQDIEKNSEIDFELNLYQSSLNKLSKIEYIIQKWTEIGFSSFNFFRGDRSQKLIFSDSKVDRLRKIIIESTEQSYRNSLPNLYTLNSSLKDILKNSKKDSLNLFFHTSLESSFPLGDIKIDLNKYSTINLFIWPEGWWSEQELSIFLGNSFKPIYLWARIMRAETVSSVVWFYIINEKLNLKK